MNRIGITSIGLAMFAGSLFAQAPAAPAATAPQVAASDPVVITYGTTQIRQSEFEAAIKTLPAEYQSFASGPKKKAFAEDYVRMKMLSSEAEKNGLQKDPEISAQIELMRENALANAEMNRMEKGIALSEPDVQKAYDDKKASLEQAKVRHILVAFKGGQQPTPAGKKELTEDEAKAKAEAIRAKIVAGTDFAETAKKESDDSSSAERGGEIGTLSRGRAPADFDKAVFDGKVGEVSAPVRTPFGYHLIQVEERKTPSLADIRPQIEQELRQQKMQGLMDTMQSGAGVKYDDAYFAAAAAEPAPALVNPVPTTPAATSIAPKKDASKKIVVPPPSGKQ